MWFRKSLAFITFSQTPNESVVGRLKAKEILEEEPWT